jgi:hypothetical protein
MNSSPFDQLASHIVDAMVPEHLRPVLADLRRAYPDGVPPGEYLPLLVVLQQDMSARNLALVVGELTGKDPVVVENDAAAAASVHRVDTAEIDRMKHHIGASGRTYEL